MSVYRYEALDAQGQTLKGKLEADSARAARSQLRAQSLLPVQVQEVSTAASNARMSQWSLGTPRTLPAAELAVWTR